MPGLAIISVSLAAFFLTAPCKGVADNDTETVQNKSGHETHVSSLAMASLSGTSSRCISRLDEWCSSSCGAGATCSWGNCYCNLGTCAGVDGRCHSGNYERLPGTYRISNSRWPDYFITMNAGLFGGASVTKGGGTETEFYISVVHGPPDGGLAVLITSVRWPDYAVAMKEYGRRSYAKKTCLVDKRLDNHAEVEDTASLLYRPPKSSPHPNATMVMIQAIFKDVFFHVIQWNSIIHGDEEDQGAGMYWYIHPPLPESLVRSMQTYMGNRCLFNCGDPLISGAMDSGQFLSSGVVTIVILVVVGMTRTFDV